MKILVLSLLRLGDIVMASSVLRGLRAKHPHAEIHLLINKQFSSIAPMLGNVDHFHFFDRKDLQDSLSDPNRPLFEAKQVVDNLLSELNGQSFDLAVNLTQNRLSGWLMGLLEANEKQGLVLDEQGMPMFGSVWFRYLNSNAYHQDELVFHFTDIFKFALDLEARKTRPHLIETDDGLRESLTWLRESTDFVAVQPLTSDSKKNWSLKSFQSAMEQIQATQPRLRFLVLGAESERAELEKWSHLWPSSLNAQLAICSLPASFSIVKRAKLLISGDTSIKHMAAATSTPILEISLGSSDPHRTGVYSDRGYIVQSKEPCFPCQHRSSCHRTEHFCGKSVSPDAVAVTALQILNGMEHQLPMVAAEYEDQIEILKVDITTTDFWRCYSLSEQFSAQRVAEFIEMSSWKLLLNEAAGQSGPLGEYGSECHRLSKWLKKVFPNTPTSELLHVVSEFEQQTLRLERRLSGVEFSLRDLRILNDRTETNDRQSGSRMFQKNLIQLREATKLSPILRGFRFALDGLIEDDRTPSFMQLRRVQDGLRELETRARIELKVMRSLQIELGD